MTAFSDEESADLETFVGLRRRVLAPTLTGRRGGMGALPLCQGLPQSVRLRLTAGGGASQLRTWLARPRHQVRLRCASRDACPPLASTARTGDARYRPVEHVPVGGRLSPSRTPPPPHRKWWVSGSTTSTATSSATATQRWAPPAPLPARRHCLFGHPSRAPSARPLPYR